MAGKGWKNSGAIRSPSRSIIHTVGTGRSMQWPAQPTEEMKPRILMNQGQRGRLSDLLTLDSEEVEHLRLRESCSC